MIDQIETAKRAKLVDLMRRATANGTYDEVAAAIARDWSPTATVLGDGSVQIYVPQ